MQLAAPAGRSVPQLGSASAQRKWVDPPATRPWRWRKGRSRSSSIQADHLKLALESNAVVNVTPTRVQYRTNTLGGSSGSPCFTQKWELAALHHRGDPKYWTRWSDESGHPVRRHSRADEDPRNGQASGIAPSS